MDWKAEISRIKHWKKITADYDKLGAFPRYAPRAAASPNRIDDSEKIAGFRFPSEFKEFLEHADGWKAFCILVDLFGTEDFLTGRSKAAMNRLELQEYLKASGFSGSQVVVIGASEFELDVYLLISPESTVLPGGVVWFAHEEVDRYPSFSAFFSAMVNYNARLAQRLVGKT